MTETEQHVMVRVCWRYFRQGQTQSEIAQALGMTRKRVNRMLQEARETGLVRVSIESPLAVCADLELRLSETFGLTEAVVAPAPPIGEDVRRTVGMAAADLLRKRLFDGARLGVNCGGTIAATADHLTGLTVQNTTIVQLVGGLAEATHINPYENVSMVARALSAKCFYMTAPMIADSAERRDQIVDSLEIRRVFDIIDGLDLALLSAVDLTEDTRAIDYGVMDDAMRQSLIAAGSVGDICGHFLSATGEKIDHPINQRTINPSMASLRQVPEVILAAGGAHKARIVRAAIRAGLCQRLVTDESCAEALLGCERPQA